MLFEDFDLAIESIGSGVCAGQSGVGVEIESDSGLGLRMVSVSPSP